MMITYRTMKVNVLLGRTRLFVMIVETASYQKSQKHPGTLFYGNNVS